jgi:hypothetical protein
MCREAVSWNECSGRSESSSSECAGDRSPGDGTSATKERSGFEAKRDVRWPRRAGDDCGSRWALFHDGAWDIELTRRGLGWKERAVSRRERFDPRLLPERGRSSENMGPVRGDESRAAAGKSESPALEEVSERPALLEEVGRFRLSSCSIWGSRDWRGRLPQPFWTLTLARARRFWRALVIFWAVSIWGVVGRGRWANL